MGLLNPRPTRSRARYGFAGALAVASLAVLGAMGGLSYAANNIAAAFNATADVVHFSGSLPSFAQRSSAGNQYGVPPHITRVVGTTSIAGNPITVTGTNIQAITNGVTVAGVAVTPTTNTPTQVKFTAPTHSGGTLVGPVHITTQYGSDSSSNVTVYQQPTIGASGLSATTLEPGLSLGITGTGFTGVLKLNFIGTTSSISTKPTVDSDTHITVTIPALIPASGHITVTGPAGASALSTQSFTFTSTHPTLTSFSPSIGVADGQHTGAQTVDIIGTGFHNTDVVKFNGVNAATQTFISSTEFHATAPAGATTGPISVVDTVGGAGISSKSFTPVKNPSVSSVTPDASPASGGGNRVGGTITIDGSNLQGVGTTVTFQGNSTPQATRSTRGSSTSIDVTVPRGATSGSMTIHNAADDATANFSLLGTPGPITISSTPHTPAIPGDTLEIDTATAGGFNGVTKVSIGKTVIQSGDFTTFTATQIKLSIPAGTTTNRVTVTNAVPLSATSTTSLTMAPAPTIKVSPGTGVADGATTITITGSNFKGVDNGASTKVTFHTGSGTSSIGATVAGDGNSLTVAPPSSTVSGTLTVVTDAGSVTGKTSFVPVKTPSVTSGAPTVDHGGDFGGKPGVTTITLTGTSLNGLTTTDTKVTFPGVVGAKSARVTGTTSLSVQIPAGATSGSLTISNSAGSVSFAGFKAITQAPAPTGPLTMTHGTTFTITGTHGFLGVTAIQIGKNKIATSNFTVTDDTHITVTLPANAKLGVNQLVMLTNAAGRGSLAGVTIN